jgi:hypothetical protein
MRPSHAEGRTPADAGCGPRRSEQLGEKLDRNNTIRWAGDQPEHFKLALAHALASASGLTYRDVAGALADLVGFLIATDPNVLTESIDAVAEAIGKTIAAVAHAERSPP